MNKKPLYLRQIIDFIEKRSSIISKTEIINLLEAEDKILAENIYSKINLPPFNNSAVDGYALIKKDLNKSQKKLMKVELLQEILEHTKSKKGKL